MAVNQSGLAPTHKRVLVRPFSGEEKSKGGILLVNQNEIKNKGTIVEVGPDAFEDWKSPPKVGDRVLYLAYAHTERGADGEEYFFVNDESIAAVLPPL